jgi:hypothetical protein
MRGATGSSGSSLVPFASSIENAPPLFADAYGNATSILALNSSNSASYSRIEPQSDGRVLLSHETQQAFSLPFDAVIENVFFTVGAVNSGSMQDAMRVYPCVQIYSAGSESNAFSPLDSARAVAARPFSGSFEPSELRMGYQKGIGARLEAGTRIFIGGFIQSEGEGDLTAAMALTFTGSLAIRQDAD